MSEIRQLHSLRLHLYRVNFEVRTLKPFSHPAFPHSKGSKTASKLPSFDGELMADSRWSFHVGTKGQRPIRGIDRVSRETTGHSAFKHAEHSAGVIW